MTLTEIYLLAIAFVVKHFMAEYLFQRPYNWLNKGTYGHMGGISHTATHAALSFFILLFEAPVAGLLLLVGVEAVIRYHVEFFKVSYVRKTGYTHIDNAPVWWILTGIQQSIYYAVYATMVILTAGSEGGFFRAVG
jgi:hypothetical protein